MKRRIIWHLEVPERLNRMLEDYIKLDSFKTKSEFIRNAVRDKLDVEVPKLVRTDLLMQKSRMEIEEK